LTIILLTACRLRKLPGSPRAVPCPQCNKICLAAPENAPATVE